MILISGLTVKFVLDDRPNTFYSKFLFHLEIFRTFDRKRVLIWNFPHFLSLVQRPSCQSLSFPEPQGKKFLIKGTNQSTTLVVCCFQHVHLPFSIRTHSFVGSVKEVGIVTLYDISGSTVRELVSNGQTSRTSKYNRRRASGVEVGSLYNGFEESYSGPMARLFIGVWIRSMTNKCLYYVILCCIVVRLRTSVSLSLI